MLADGPPLVGLMLIVIIGVILIAMAVVIIVVGIALAVVVALAVVSLVSLGILSSSVLVAFRSGSASKGVRLAMFQICAALGAVAGLGLAAGVKIFCNVRLGWAPVEAIGMLCGTGTGMVIGASFSTVLKYLLNRWERRTDKGFEVILQPVAIHETPDRSSMI